MNRRKLLTMFPSTLAASVVVSPIIGQGKSGLCLCDGETKYPEECLDCIAEYQRLFHQTVSDQGENRFCAISLFPFCCPDCNRIQIAVNVNLFRADDRAQARERLTAMSDRVMQYLWQLPNFGA